MAATVVKVPQGGSVAARPRRENYYDSENIVAASSVLTFPFFQDARSNTDGAAAKVYGLDTNQIGQGGQIPRGHFLRVFGVQIYYTYAGTITSTWAAHDDVRKQVDTAWWRLNLGSIPFMDVPLHRIPAGTGFAGTLSTTENNLTAGFNQIGWPVLTNYYDLTVPGKVKVQMPDGTIREQRMPRIPLEFAETETFTAEIRYNSRPSVTSGRTLKPIMNLVAIYLKPL